MAIYYHLADVKRSSQQLNKSQSTTNGSSNNPNATDYKFVLKEFEERRGMYILFLSVFH